MDDRQAYQKKVEAKLDEWKAEIDKLKAKAEGTEADARIRFNEEIDRLREYQHAAEAQLDRMRNASGAAWDDMKAGMDAAWNNLSEAAKKAYGRFD